MNRFSWRQWVVILAFLLVVAVTGLFAVHTVRHALYWRLHRDDPIRPWMSVHHIAHSYRVPPYVLYQAIGLPPIAHDKRPLRELAREQHKPVSILIGELQNAIAHSRPPYPPPPPQPPPEGGRAP